MKQKQKQRLMIWLILIGAVIVVFLWTEPEYGYLPEEQNILASADSKLMKSKADSEEMQLGKETFYRETFGNEIFFSDVMGLWDGPLSPGVILREAYKVRETGTDNLRIPLNETVKVGDRTFQKDTYINTGIDVPKGSYTPLGLTFKYQDGRLKVGMSCAFCHATVDERGKVMEGVPNQNLQAGTLWALASNSAAYFSHTDVNPIREYLKGDKPIIDSSEKKTPLPDSKKMEEEVDRALLRMAPGTFDMTQDLIHNPTAIPDVFTKGDAPYGWNGFAHDGAMDGLVSMTSMMHSQIADPLAQATRISDKLGIDREIYIGTILQRASSDKLRLRGQHPSLFWQKNKPKTESPGVLEAKKSPQWPAGSNQYPDGLLIGGKKFKPGEQVRALALWQNSLLPPPYHSQIKDKHSRDQLVTKGKEIFKRAGCMSCHSGDFYSDQRRISLQDIGTSDLAAAPLAELAHPLGKGYKTKSLIGLHLTAPYLHDNGVAVGYYNGHWGLPGTLLAQRPVDPTASLRALLDREWRRKVVDANKSSDSLRKTGITGEGHHFWVDREAGFTGEEQRALIEYLLSLDRPGK